MLAEDTHVYLFVLSGSLAAKACQASRNKLSNEHMFKIWKATDLVNDYFADWAKNI
jgi:hypothetical protein